MSLEENIKTLVHDVKVRKDAWVNEHPDHPDMPTLVCAYREGEMVAQGLAMPDRDQMILMAKVMRFGCAANEITMAFETYHTTLDKNPLTEEKWGPDEMAFIAQEHNGIELGWVTEATSLMGYNDKGEFFMATLPFVVKEGTIEWGEDMIMRSDEMTGEQRVDGFVHRNLLDAMEGPTMMDKAKEDFGADIYEVLHEQIPNHWIHSDIATIKHLLKGGMAQAAGLCAPPDSERAKNIDVLLKASLERDKDKRYKILFDSSTVNN